MRIEDGRDLNATEEQIITHIFLNDLGLSRPNVGGHDDVGRPRDIAVINLDGIQRSRVSLRTNGPYSSKRGPTNLHPVHQSGSRSCRTPKQRMVTTTAASVLRYRVCFVGVLQIPVGLSV